MPPEPLGKWAGGREGVGRGEGGAQRAASGTVGGGNPRGGGRRSHGGDGRGAKRPATSPVGAGARAPSPDEQIPKERPDRGGGWGGGEGGGTARGEGEGEGQSGGGPRQRGRGFRRRTKMFFHARPTPLRARNKTHPSACLARSAPSGLERSPPGSKAIGVFFFRAKCEPDQAPTPGIEKHFAWAASVGRAGQIRRCWGPPASSLRGWRGGFVRCPFERKKKAPTAPPGPVHGEDGFRGPENCQPISEK